MRGLLNHLVRRVERVEGDLTAERNARVDDLALLVDLITSGWQGVDARLARLERALDGGATVHRIDERRAAEPAELRLRTHALPVAEVDLVVLVARIAAGRVGRRRAARDLAA